MRPNKSDFPLLVGSNALSTSISAGMAHVCGRGMARGFDLGSQHSGHSLGSIQEKEKPQASTLPRRQPSGVRGMLSKASRADQVYLRSFSDLTPGGAHGKLERFDHRQSERAGASDQQATIEDAQHVSICGHWRGNNEALLCENETAMGR